MTYEPATVPCGLCERPTIMTATKRCDRCWELETRIRMNPELAKQILIALEHEHLREKAAG